MMPNISLKQLKVFVAVTQNQTLTAASETLFLSKAAVSMSLSELEKQIGHALFDRVNNRLVLNQEGQKLLPLADELLSRSRDIECLFSDEQSYQGQLRIGASDTVGNQLAPFLLSDFRHSLQHKAQQLFISNTALICQKLVDYELDIGLVEGKTLHPELNSTPFSEDQMCIVAAADHPLTRRPYNDLASLENSDWILREPGSGTREFFLRAVAPRIEVWHEAFELNTTEAIINCVSANLGLACLSKLAAQAAINDGRIQEVPIALDMKRRFWLLVHKEKYQSPLLKRFIAFCQAWENGS
ncbi:LysR family transcriptional regulator [Vibrio hangzhouensis]|uniref:LysR family transcriptional regulator n=1 Tax=Vibrio hangzhouensis TaxID=462991 RepID=UPI001C9519DB|nr:LysR family transcriptional regulator [Vibrio hangzhouensis]MBY6198863.1 LysR family transcriptional regulator [Vibrio hangzhouensis]